MEFLFAIIFGFFLAMAFIGIWLAITLAKIQREGAQAADQIRDFANEVISKLVFLKIEEHPEGLFAYDAVSGDYVCQGKDMDALNEAFGKRFPHKKGVLVKPEEGEAHDLHSVQNTKQ